MNICRCCYIPQRILTLDTLIHSYVTYPKWSAIHFQIKMQCSQAILAKIILMQMHFSDTPYQNGHQVHLSTLEPIRQILYSHGVKGSPEHNIFYGQNLILCWQHRKVYDFLEIRKVIICQNLCKQIHCANLFIKKSIY